MPIWAKSVKFQVDLIEFINFQLALMNSDLTLVSRGKVRDVYSTSSPDHLLFVATDRISVYDVILQNVGGVIISRQHRMIISYDLFRVSQTRENSLLKYPSFGLTNFAMLFQTTS